MEQRGDRKVEVKKRAYTKLDEIKDEEDKQNNSEEYKIARQEEKLEVTRAKDMAFESLYVR